MLDSIYSFGYRLPRFRTDFHLLLQTADRQPLLLDGRCTDISEEGLGAQFPTALEIGSTVKLILTLPGSSISLHVSARVTNRKGEFHGFAFLFPSQQERDHVHNYIKSLRSHTIPLSRGSR